MILIDTKKTNQKLVLTLTEKTTVDSPAYQLAFTNDATKESYSIALTGTLKNTNSRYDLFELATTLFSGMPIGYYTYTIYQDAEKLAPIEIGKLLIRDNESVEIITPIKSEEYIIYK